MLGHHWTMHARRARQPAHRPARGTPVLVWEPAATTERLHSLAHALEPHSGDGEAAEFGPRHK